MVRDPPRSVEPSKADASEEQLRQTDPEKNRRFSGAVYINSTQELSVAEALEEQVP